jgi:epoxyqueuosine reductase QueG
LDLTEGVINFAKEKGADLVGVADAELFKVNIWPFGRTPIDRGPNAFLPDAKSVIVVAIKMVDSLLNRLTGKTDVHSQTLRSYLHFYNYDLLDYIAVQTARYLEEKNFEAYPIQARVFEFDKIRTLSAIANGSYATFPFKVAAIAAGLGVAGKCSLLITPQYGPRVRLVSVITDANLRHGKPLNASIEKICGDCRDCIKACPIGALVYDENIKKFSIDMPSCHGLMIENGCGLCMAACPLGKKPRNRLKEIFRE